MEEWTMRFSRPGDFNDTFDSDFRTQRPQPKIRLLYRRSLGIFCLTANPDNHLMWVHYAAQHTGYAIGFDTTNEVFSENGAVPTKVRYVPVPPKLPPDAEPTADLSCRKAKAWDYEEEWRCVRIFAPSESRSIQFTPQAIARVILGSKMAPHHIARVLQTVDALRSEHQIEVYDSRPDPDTWSFTHVLSPRRLCSQCLGSGHII